MGDEAFAQRSLYYWSKIYSSQLKEKEEYGSLRPAICVNLLEFELFKDLNHFHSCFMPFEKNNPEFALTDHLIIHFIELPKYFQTTNTTLEEWLYFFRNAEKRGG